VISFLEALNWRILVTTEIQALNFALSLEHFQSYFYERLHHYEPQDFSNAGLPPWSKGRYAQIYSHELTHAQFLENILGDKAVQPCTYNLSVRFLSVFHMWAEWSLRQPRYRSDIIREDQ
jgi:hypothetical protein